MPLSSVRAHVCRGLLQGPPWGLRFCLVPLSYSQLAGQGVATGHLIPNCATEGTTLVSLPFLPQANGCNTDTLWLLVRPLKNKNKNNLLLTPSSSEGEVRPPGLIQSSLNSFSSLSPVSDSTRGPLKASGLSTDWGHFRPPCF